METEANNITTVTFPVTEIRVLTRAGHPDVIMLFLGKEASADIYGRFLDTWGCASLRLEVPWGEGLNVAELIRKNACGPEIPIEVIDTETAHRSRR